MSHHKGLCGLVPYYSLTLSYSHLSFGSIIMFGTDPDPLANMAFLANPVMMRVIALCQDAKLCKVGTIITSGFNEGFNNETLCFWGRTIT